MTGGGSVVVQVWLDGKQTLPPVPRHQAFIPRRQCPRGNRAQGPGRQAHDNLRFRTTRQLNFHVQTFSHPCPSLGCVGLKFTGGRSARPSLRTQSRSAGDRHIETSAELEDHLRPARRTTNSLPGARRFVAGGVGAGPRRLLGFRQGLLRSIPPCRLRRPAADIPPTVLLESAGMGPGRQALGLEHPGKVGHGPANGQRVEGPMDCCHSGWRFIVFSKPGIPRRRSLGGR